MTATSGGGAAWFCSASRAQDKSRNSVRARTVCIFCRVFIVRLSEPERQLHQHVAEVREPRQAQEGVVELRFKRDIVVQFHTQPSTGAVTEPDVREYRGTRGSVDVLVTEVGTPAFAKPSGDLAVERRGIEDFSGAFLFLPNKEAFIQKLEARSHVHNVR